MVKSLESLNNIFNVSYDGRPSKRSNGKIIYSNETVLFMKKLKEAQSLESINALSIKARDDMDKLSYSINSVIERISTIRQVSERISSYSAEAANFCNATLAYSTEGKFKEGFDKVIKWIKELWNKFRAWCASRWKFIRVMFKKVIHKLRQLFMKKKKGDNTPGAPVPQAAAFVADRPELSPTKTGSNVAPASGMAKPNSPVRPLSAQDQAIAAGKAVPRNDNYTIYIPQMSSPNFRPLSEKFYTNPENLLFVEGVKEYKPSIYDDKVDMRQFQRMMEEFEDLQIYESHNNSSATTYPLQEGLRLKSNTVDLQWLEAQLKKVERLEAALGRVEREIFTAIDGKQTQLENNIKQLDASTGTNSTTTLEEIAKDAQVAKDKFDLFMQTINKPIISYAAMLSHLQ